MVNIFFQNAHVGNGSKGFEKEISIYVMKVVQVDLPTIMKSQIVEVARPKKDKSVLINHENWFKMPMWSRARINIKTKRKI